GSVVAKPVSSHRANWLLLLRRRKTYRLKRLAIRRSNGHPPSMDSGFDGRLGSLRLCPYRDRRHIQVHVSYLTLFSWRALLFVIWLTEVPHEAHLAFLPFSRAVGFCDFGSGSVDSPSRSGRDSHDCFLALGALGST